MHTDTVFNKYILQCLLVEPSGVTHIRFYQSSRTWVSEWHYERGDLFFSYAETALFPGFEMSDAEILDFTVHLRGAVASLGYETEMHVPQNMVTLPAFQQLKDFFLEGRRAVVRSAGYRMRLQQLRSTSL